MRGNHTEEETTGNKTTRKQFCVNTILCFGVGKTPSIILEVVIHIKIRPFRNMAGNELGFPSGRYFRCLNTYNFSFRTVV